MLHKTFLMDGVAYPKETGEPETVTPVVLSNNGTEYDNTELQVVLRRAAAKINGQNKQRSIRGV